MATDRTQDLVWASLFMADVRSRYFAEIAARLRSTERYLALFVALTSSGVVVSILAGVPGAPIALSLCSAIAAAVLAAFKVDKRAAVGASLSRQWLEIASEYQVLWSRIGEVSDKTSPRARAQALPGRRDRHLRVSPRQRSPPRLFRGGQGELWARRGGVKRQAGMKGETIYGPN